MIEERNEIGKKAKAFTSLKTYIDVLSTVLKIGFASCVVCSPVDQPTYDPLNPNLSIA